jgi:hypothetical protein
MSSSSNFAGESEPIGVPFTFYLKKMPQNAKLQVLDGVRVIYETAPLKKAGVTQVVWNFVKGTSAPAQQPAGQGQRQSGRMRSLQTAGPGTYTVKLIVDGKEQTRTFSIMKDI